MKIEGTAQETLANKKFWAISALDAIKVLETSEEGLSEVIAKERIEQFGGNVLPEEKRGLRLRILLRQFTSPLIIILIVAGVVTLSLQDFKDGIFIFFAVLVNTALGFYQENKAEDALSRLKTYVKDKARVIRDGLEREIGAEELVPGDVVRLTAGTRVPADARLFLSNNLSVDESILTGESLPVTKTTEAVKESAGVIDRESMVYGGTLVAGGIGLAVITATGINTELGKIAKLLKEKRDEPTPLQKYIKKFSIWAGVVFLLLSAALFVLGITLGHSVFEMFLISVAVAVSAVPEGLPIALTVVLAVGVERLARQKGVVKKLLSAEALGSTTLILTDKTGTLTEAKMKLAEIIGNEHKEKILKLALVAVEATVENPASNPSEWRVIGSPLEAAVVKAGADYEIFLSDLAKEVEILERRPFNSSDKFSAVNVRMNSEKFWVHLGAPDILLEMSKGGGKEKKEMTEKINELAYGGFRLLGVTRNNEFVGILAFNDPLRDGIRDVINDVERAGVKTVIATGDHKGTAIHVAKEVGMNVSDGAVITGEEIQKISDIELKKALPKIKVFARVTPEHKSRITKLYQEMGEVVAMTGDGVNDAPALEGADVGIAVGSGTDIAKNSADLVLLDNNFKTIVAAIGEGRHIMANIKKIFVYLLSDSLDELFLIGGALVFGLALPLNALQILWVNFFSDSFSSVALAFEKEGDGLTLPRHKKGKGIIDNEMKFLIFVIGVISSALLFILYYFLLKFGYEENTVRTFIFASFAVYTLFLAFSMKSLRRSILRYNPFDNLYLVGGVLIGIVLTFAAVYIPYLQGLLGTVSLSLPWVLSVFGFGILNIAGVEFGKFIFRKTI